MRIINYILFFGLSLFFSEVTGYSQWSKGFPTDSTFFPLSVWLQSPSNGKEFTDIGINTFVGLWEGPTEDQLTSLQSQGIYVVADQNTVGLTSTHNGIIKSWMHQDEPDNAQSDGSGGYGPCIAPSVLVALYNGWKVKDPNRPVMLNFGQGVSFLGWYGRGYLTNIGGKDYSVAGGHYSDYYTEASAGADIVTYDIYPVTSTDAEVKGKLEYVAQGVKNLVQWTGGNKRVWNCIETCHINNSSTRPTADQIRSEVWMSIIAGSKGIIYFCHEWQPSFREDGFFRYPEIVTAISGINSQIKSLAPVLNKKSVSSGVQVISSNTSVPIDFMVKQYKGDSYIFAAAMRNTAVTGTFTVTGASANTVEVLGENRNITMSNGSFHDNFAGYGVHIYHISSLTLSTPTLTVSPAFTSINPNPFNSTTNISFYLPSQAFVSVKIFDSKGRELTMLVSETMSVGNHSRQWDASIFPSGVYYCRILAGNSHQTKKLILMR
jgi:hypothetical protein